MSVTLYDANQFQIISHPDADNIVDIIKENLGDEHISATRLDRIKIPGSGGLMWRVPDFESSDGFTMQKSLEVILIMHHPSRILFKDKYDGVKRRPDCTSDDAKFGTGPIWADMVDEGEPTPMVDCSTCAFAQWDSGHNGRGQLCKLQHNLFVIRKDEMLPALLTLPPTSLRPFKDFTMKMSSRGIPFYGAVINIGLELVSNGKVPDYSRCVFSKKVTLEAADVRRMALLHETLSPILRAKARQLESEELEVAPA